ncbi:hypothetical protein OD350_28905 (plasmid) [Clostridium beijerinckii]|uniref:hypothetical protein n=1 Tax=Clostridium beijerinckii TaxID=1520 RepID=UPI002225BD65|nr:hypothetical protein [Clostridium beijerinckii]UYZ39095.1 hypothetical protein OD350_28905 [Clostridium beijerinckii]
MQLVGFIYRENNKVKEVDINLDNLAIKTGSIALVVIGGLNGGAAHAGTVTQSLQPLVDVLKDLAEPVSYGFMIKGFMKIMAGEEHEGLKVIKGAIGGYIGIQWIPYIFSIIKSIKF